MSAKLPKYRRHPNGQAFIEYQGKRHYLGVYDSKESRERYRSFINQILSGGIVVPSIRLEGTTTIDECIVHYLPYAEGYYGKTKELHHFQVILEDLSAQYGSTAAGNFGPKALESLRESWIIKGWCRKNINHQVARIRRFFRWCGARELIPGEIAQRLECLEPLRAGKTKARESKKVKPAPRETVDALLPFLQPHIAAMVQVQYLCGMRPQDVCQMRGCDIDTSGPIWLYTVPQHKGTHLEQTLVKAIPAKAKAILLPYLARDPEAYLFSPHDSARHLGRKAAERRSKTVRPCYDSDSYRKAVEYGFAKAKRRKIVISHWSPNQLRHLIATEVSQLLGQQKAQRWLGHQDLETTAIYAEQEVSELIAIAQELDRRWAS